MRWPTRYSPILSISAGSRVVSRGLILAIACLNKQERNRLGILVLSPAHCVRTSADHVNRRGSQMRLPTGQSGMERACMAEIPSQPPILEVLAQRGQITAMQRAYGISRRCAVERGSPARRTSLRFGCGHGRSTESRWRSLLGYNQGRHKDGSPHGRCIRQIRTVAHLDTLGPSNLETRELISCRYHRGCHRTSLMDEQCACIHFGNKQEAVPPFASVPASRHAPLLRPVWQRRCPKAQRVSA